VTPKILRAHGSGAISDVSKKPSRKEGAAVLDWLGLCDGRE